MSVTPGSPPVSTPKAWRHHLSGRFLPGLLILSATIIAWGCAGHRGQSPTVFRCPDSVQAKVSAENATVSVSYTEPSVSIDGMPLTDLAKTTIYYDLGSGRTLAKDIPATMPTGGGQISETITIPIRTRSEQTALICVTATDHRGNESPMTP